MTDHANPGQHDYWNGEVGRRWLACADELDAMNAAITAHLIAEAAPAPQSHVLEVGCGTGTLALALAARVPEGEVVALDVSAVLLARARERQAPAGVTNLSFREADAQTAALPPGHFDLAISQFGVMFFADPVAAFRNIRGALRPGGRLLFAAFGPAAENPWLALSHAAAARRLGAPPPAPADAPGPTAFADIARVRGILEAAGFRDVTGGARTLPHHHPGGAAAAAQLATMLGPAGFILRVSGAGEPERAAVAADIAAAFAPFKSDDGVRIPGTINIVSAIAP